MPDPLKIQFKPIATDASLGWAIVEYPPGSPLAAELAAGHPVTLSVVPDPADEHTAAAPGGGQDAPRIERLRARVIGLTAERDEWRAELRETRAQLATSREATAIRSAERDEANRSADGLEARLRVLTASNERLAAEIEMWRSRFEAQAVSLATAREDRDKAWTDVQAMRAAMADAVRRLWGFVETAAATEGPAIGKAAYLAQYGMQG